MDITIDHTSKVHASGDHDHDHPGGPGLPRADSKADPMLVVIGSAYENASKTSGVISYEPGLSSVITALGMPPRRCVAGMGGTPVCDSSKSAMGCWNA